MVCGSSPLARGLQVADLILIGQNRIIPARAGFTISIRVGRGTTTDHPRSRGVYDRVWIALMADAGSSPLARGLQEIGG